MVSPDTAETASDGKAQAQWILGSTSGSQRVMANVVGVDGLEVTFEAVAGPGGASRIDVVGGDGQTAAVGTALDDSLVVRVLDRFGNPVSGIGIDWDVDGGSVDPATVTTGSDGRAATYRILGRSVGSQTATASSAGLEGSPVTFTSTAVPGSASELVRVSGDHQSGRPGTALDNRLVVRLVDAEGNGIPNHAVSWVVGAGGGSVDSPNGTTEVLVLDASGNRFTDREIEVKLELTGDNEGKLRGDPTKRTKSGVATFSDIRVSRPGEYELRASAEGLPTVGSARFQVEDDHHGEHD